MTLEKRFPHCFTGHPWRRDRRFMLQAAGGAGQAGNALQRDELDDIPTELLEAE